MRPPAARGRAKSSARKSALVLAASALLPLLGGCAGSLSGSFPPPSGTGGAGGGAAAASGGATGGARGSAGGSTGVCDAPGTVFSVHCGGLGCHQPGSQSPDLLTAPVEQALIGKTAAFMCPGVPDQLYVDAARPPSGVLFLRITGDTCIDQMPQGQPPLAESDIQCITDWVTSKLP